MTFTPSVRAARRPDGQKANGMRVVEIFQSKQGEGLWTGVTSTFVRTVGCNLHCGFCDTTYASWQSERGVDLAVEEIVGRAILLDNRHVVLTGGEPMIQSETVMLTELLAERKYTVTVETAGTVYLPIKCDLMSISPKLSNSIPEGVTEIEYSAFDGCVSLPSLTIPKSVEKFGRNVFRKCPELTVTVYRGTAGEDYCRQNSVLFVYGD